jgi:hypothetical protein
VNLPLGRSAAWLIAGAIGLFLVLRVLGRLSGPSSSQAADAIADAKTWLGAAKIHHAARIQIAAAGQASADTARADSADAVHHETADHQRDAALTLARTAADTIPILLAQLADARAANARWADAFAKLARSRTADSLRADQAEAELARGQVVAAAVTKVADCRILGVGFFPRCLSRVHSFEAGVLTTVAIVVLKPKVHL